MMTGGSNSNNASLHGIMVGMGNPLLDISAVVDEQFLQKYGLKSNDAILAEPKHLPIYDELSSKPDVQYTAGGATQNTCRIVQHMLYLQAPTKNQNNITYFGCVGNDKYGKEMYKQATKDGVNVKYQIDYSGIQTGTCAVCITTAKHERSLVANLGAANKFTIGHLHHAEQHAIIHQAQYFYSAGFFLTVSPASLMHIATHADENNKVLGINLAAPFICQFFKEPLIHAIEYSDYVFGNETEASAFAESMGLLDKTPHDVAKYLSTYVSKRKWHKTGQHQRIAIITQGSNPTIVAINGHTTEYPVPPLEASKIVDSNGAGDAFVGGFFSQLVQGKSIEQCVNAGHWASRQILQVSGIVLDAFPKEVPEF